jgi:hypothetical protein
VTKRTAVPTRRRARWYSTRVRTWRKLSKSDEAQFDLSKLVSAGFSLGGFSLADDLLQRTGVKITDERVRNAAHRAFHPPPPPASRRCGPREDVIFNACVGAIVDLVRALQGASPTDPTDLCAVADALAHYGWGPRGWNTPFGAIDQSAYPEAAAIYAARRLDGRDEGRITP